MRSRESHARSSVAGFTLIEALTALVLMSLVLTALATITGQWIPNWSRGFARVQRSELLASALDRIVADLAAVEFVPPNRGTKQLLFEGTERSVTFVRTTLGPNTRPGLDIINIKEASDRVGSVLIRTRTAFAPGASTQRQLGDPVTLLRAPYRVSFSYAGRDGVWRSNWLDAGVPPAAVRLIVRDTTNGKTLSASTSVLIHTQVPAACVGANADDDCNDGTDANPANKSEISMESDLRRGRTR